MSEDNTQFAMQKLDQQPDFSMTKSDPAAVAAAESAKTRIQSAYMMALHKPRNTEQARSKILAHCRRPRFAEKVKYSKPMGKTPITGPSVRLMEVALREYTNVMVESQVIYEDDMIRRKKVFVTDLENNTSFNEEIQTTKTVERKSSNDREVISSRKNSYGDTVYLVKATDDELIIKEASMVSKAIRNLARRIIPDDLIEEAMEIAEQTLKDEDSVDPDASMRKVLDAFSKINVMPKDIEKYLGHGVTQLVAKEIQDLRVIYQSIRDGESKWPDYVGGSTSVVEGDDTPKAPKKSIFEKKKDKPAPEKAKDEVVIPEVIQPKAAPEEAKSPDMSF